MPNIKAAIKWTLQTEKRTQRNLDVKTRLKTLFKKAKAGTVWINTYGYTDVRLPWGGSRDSGFGREHGDIAIENFTEPKVVWINTGI